MYQGNEAKFKRVYHFACLFTKYYFVLSYIKGMVLANNSLFKSFLNLLNTYNPHWLLDNSSGRSSGSNMHV